MNGQNLLMGLSYIDRKFIEESEMDAMPKRRQSLRRPLLVAAIVALSLLLVGCAVVHIMRMQDLHIGGHTVIHQAAEESEPTEVQLEVLSLQGMKNTPAYLANQEWLQFTESYTPERGDYWESEEAYWAYSVLDQTMVDKVDELCGKYGLKVIGKPWHEHQDCNQFLKLIGIQSLLESGSSAALHIPQGRFFEGGSFTIYGDIALSEGDPPAYITYQYVCKDVFYDVFAYVDPDTVTERPYTTADGTAVLLLEGENSGIIMADREDSFITIDVALTNGISLEAVADQFDFTIQASTLDASAAAEREQASIAASSAGIDPDRFRRATYGEYIQDLLDAEQEKLMMGFAPSEISEWEYAFHDLDGDGTQDLLLYVNGLIGTVVGWEDGKTHEGKSYGLTLCENNVLIQQDEYLVDETWYHIFRFANDGDTVFSNPKEQSIVRLKQTPGGWWRTSSTDHYAEFDTPITEAEAMEILNTYYKPITLDTKPISEFQEP